MKINSSADMIALGAKIAKEITSPLALELIGDVGVGKTTLVQGLAQGLKIKEPVTSPSFTINKKYKSENGTTLSHYDFYRLSDPGLMKDELAESIADKNTITVVEWAETVKNVLPKNTLQVQISYDDSDENARSVSVTSENNTLQSKIL
jgi:tRNA threonylcarbamoyladenosine biosynthesis protein TsaE